MAAPRTIKTYAVDVNGFPAVVYSARSPAKARVMAWRAYLSAYDASFKDFLRISTVRRIADPDGMYDRILVDSIPATRVIGRSNGHYVYFVYDDSDVVLCSHPMDVAKFPTQAAA